MLKMTIFEEYKEWLDEARAMPSYDSSEFDEKIKAIVRKYRSTDYARKVRARSGDFRDKTPSQMAKMVKAKAKSVGLAT